MPAHSSHQNFYFTKIAKTLHRFQIMDHPLHTAIKQITGHHYAPNMREILDILPYLLDTPTELMYRFNELQLNMFIRLKP